MLSFIPPASCEPGVLAAYAPFIRDGFVSLVGSDVKVPIKILRDTGAYESYIVDSVLPLSEKTDTGDCILNRGMGLTILSIPLHKMILSCESVQGEISVCMQSVLLIKVVHFILGNGLADSWVWADTSYLPVVTLQPSGASGGVHDVFSSCVVTRAGARAGPVALADVECDKTVKSLSDFPLSVSRSELVQEQQSDSSLKELYDRVLSGSEMSSAASGYFLQNGLLLRKWVTMDYDYMGEAIFQVVLPVKFCWS